MCVPSLATGCRASSPGPAGAASRRPTTAGPATEPAAADGHPAARELLAAAGVGGGQRSSGPPVPSTFGAAAADPTAGGPWELLQPAGRGRGGRVGAPG